MNNNEENTIMAKKEEVLGSVLTGLSILGGAILAASLIQTFGKKETVYRCPNCDGAIKQNTPKCPHCETNLEW